ncbi:MAG: hypothetical protein KDC92_00420 [Bacteroidetes bacterium]|nr:hypothetical protein [Bacteroidota bacterium]
MKRKIEKSTLFVSLIIVSIWLLATSLKSTVDAPNSEIRAFMTITQSQQVSIAFLNESNAQRQNTIKTFVQYQEEDKNAIKVWEQTIRAEQLSKNLSDFIKQLEKVIVEVKGTQKYGEQNGENGSYIGSKRSILVEADNTKSVTKLLSGKDKNYTYGRDLKRMINETKVNFINLFDGLKGTTQLMRDNLYNALPLIAEDNPEPNKHNDRYWEHATFNNLSVAGALAVLGQIQVNLQVSYAMVLDHLTSSITAGKIEISDFQVMIKQNKALLSTGEKLEANIFLSAQVGGIQPTILVDGQAIDVENEMGKYSTLAANQGTFQKQVEVRLVSPKTGKISSYYGNISYEVKRSEAQIIAPKNNVLFLGLDNPIEISVAGYEPNNIIANLEPSHVGTLTKMGPGKYVAHINQRDREGCKIVVSVKNANGEYVQKGSEWFRTMKVPMPIANLNNKTGGNISASELRLIQVVNATLGNFLYEGIRFKVDSYSYEYIKTTGEKVVGSCIERTIAPQLKQAFYNATPGDKFIIHQIEASAKGLGSESIPGALYFDVK